MKHTKGQWIVRNTGEVGTDKKLIAVIYPIEKGTKEENKANARLIASPPELLEVLKDLMAMRDKCFIPNDNDWWDNKAKQAISRYEKEGK